MSLPYLKDVLILLHEDVVVSMKGMSSSSCQKVRVGHVHALLPVVLWAIHSTVWLVPHEHPHELILRGQQVLNADRCAWWRSGGLSCGACP
jgi:hypothetical protein